MQITKKRTELFKLLSSLDTLNSLKGVKFAYSVSLIKRLLKKEVDTYKELSEPSEEIIKFNTERTKLAQEYSEKDEAGNAKVTPDGKNYLIQEDKKEEFETKFNELKAENQVAVDEQEAKNKELVEFLNEEITIEFKPIREETIPEDISVEQMEVVQGLIEN